MAEGLVERAADATAGRMPSVAAAFTVLIRQSWPGPTTASSFAAVERERDARAACRKLLAALDTVHEAFPTAMFWWKDESSRFLGFCDRFALAAGVSAAELLGRTDVDPSVAWNRQGALYMRDDREVLVSKRPRFDIVERQDRDSGTVWLRTSKVPYFGEAGSGTVGGFDTISAAEARRLGRV